MAKKNRNVRRAPTKRVPVSRPEPLAGTPGAPALGGSGGVANAEMATGQATIARKSLDFSEEYHYVISDLKRVGVLAAALILLLIVLSFVL
jgi:hypothetical protein